MPVPIGRLLRKRLWTFWSTWPSRRSRRSRARSRRAWVARSREVYRIIQLLERRGYLQRDPASDLYVASLKLFTLAHSTQQIRGLSDAAIGPMRELVNAINQSCHLAVLDRRRGGDRLPGQFAAGDALLGIAWRTVSGARDQFGVGAACRTAA